MLNSTSFSQLAPKNPPRAASQTSKSRHGRRTGSAGRRPKVERVVSMSRHPSHKSDVKDPVTVSASPIWTKNEKYLVTRLSGRPSQLDKLSQYRTLLFWGGGLMCSAREWNYLGRLELCLDSYPRSSLPVAIYKSAHRPRRPYLPHPLHWPSPGMSRLPQRGINPTRSPPPETHQWPTRVLGRSRFRRRRRSNPARGSTIYPTPLPGRTPYLPL
jgi:hypothetical protein